MCAQRKASTYTSWSAAYKSVRNSLAQRVLPRARSTFEMRAACVAVPRLAAAQRPRQQLFSAWTEARWGWIAQVLSTVWSPLGTETSVPVAVLIFAACLPFCQASSCAIRAAKRVQVRHRHDSEHRCTAVKREAFGSHWQSLSLRHSVSFARVL